MNRIVSADRWTLGCLIVMLSGCGGHAPPPAKPAPRAVQPVVASHALCSLKTTIALDVPPAKRSYPTGYWFGLLISGYQSSGEFSRPGRDCQGAPVSLEWDGCPTDAQPMVLPGRAMTQQDLVVTTLDEKHRLVWAMTTQLSDGEAEGPVAIAEMAPDGIDVVTLGVLRAYPQHVSLRLVQVGTSSVLIADGENCASGPTGNDCLRAVRLLPVIGDRFAARPLVDAGGSCLGRALIPVRGSGTASGDSRTTYNVETLVTSTDGAVVLKEQLAIDSQAHHAASASGNYVTRVQEERQVVVRGGNLVATGPSLLSRWLVRHRGRQPTAP